MRDPMCWLCAHAVLTHIRTCHTCGCLAHYARENHRPATATDGDHTEETS